MDHRRCCWSSPRYAPATCARPVTVANAWNGWASGSPWPHRSRLVVTVLHLLVGWPQELGAVAAAATALVPLGLLASESRRMASARQPVPGPGAGGVRLRRRGLGHLPRGRPGPRPRAHHDGGQGGPGPLHGRLRGGGGDLRAGALALPRIRHPVRLRVARGARRDSANVREPHDPRHPHGRAAAPAGRVAAQDARPVQRGDLHRCRRGARADRLGSRSRARLHRGVAAGAPRRDPGRGLGNGVGRHLVAVAAGRAGRRAAQGGSGEPRGGVARAHRGRAQPRRPARSPRKTTGC